MSRPKLQYYKRKKLGRNFSNTRAALCCNIPIATSSMVHARGEEEERGTRLKNEVSGLERVFNRRAAAFDSIGKARQHFCLHMQLYWGL